MNKLNVVILISGYGSNLKNIINYNKKKEININITCVISDNANANGLKIAREENIETCLIDNKKELGQELDKILANKKMDLIVLAGFMKILPPNIIQKYFGKILNIHPSLLPKYPGLNTHEQVIKNNESEHGATVHFVTEKLDGGPLIIQGKIKIKNTDTIKCLKEKVHKIEYEIYPIAINWFQKGLIKQEKNFFIFKNKRIDKPIEHILG
ncbi:MAG: phosphoribosylglycinamide formyltransferase [Gammaproteobacteria bacterium]|nr:phosphoribosylglycinamide formyltransferase [Gammaproteobacteria bacterium]|tara:strand:- start:196405 stop:197037 length:633 start_codon:yes stop_codon:yes gene_type:complete